MEIPTRTRSSSIGGELLQTADGNSPSLTSSRRPSQAINHSPPSTSNNKINESGHVASNYLTKRVDVVIMCGSSGSRLFPLTINSPKCLLPVCNTPVLYYLLCSLQKLGFVDIILVTTPEFKDALAAFLSNKTNGISSKNVSCVVLPDSSQGTCDALKFLRQEDKLHGDSVLVLPGEAIVGSQIIALLDKHQKLGSDLTMLLMKGPPPEEPIPGKAPPKKKKRDPEEVEYVGVAGADARLVMKVPALAVDVEEGLSVSKTLLARLNATGNGGKVQIRADLTDMHIFMLSRWAIDVAAQSGKYPSLKSDLLPLLIRKQFHPPAPSASTKQNKVALAPRDRSMESMIAMLSASHSQERSRNGVLSDAEISSTMEVLDKLTMSKKQSSLTNMTTLSEEGSKTSKTTSTSSSMSHLSLPPPASPSVSVNLNDCDSNLQEPLELCRCYAHIVEFPVPTEASSLLCTRAVSVQAYLESNRLIAAWQNSEACSGGNGSKKGGDTAPWGLIPGLTSNNATVVGKEVVMDGKVQMRQSVIGDGCVIGGGVKLNDSVIMEGVKIGAGAIIQNSVICAGANIGDSAVLKNCQVAAGFEVPASTKGTDECFNEMGVHEHSEEEDQFDEE